jgi:type II secretory pathway pseudopilin PulG
MSEIDLNEQEAGVPGFWHRYRLLIIVALIGAALVGWLYVSKGTAVQQAQQAAAAERAALLKQADAQHADTVKRSLNLFGVPLAWAMRREMMAGNLDQVDQYVSDLVKLDGVVEVTVAKEDGTIVVASDRRQVGAAFGSLYAERYLREDAIVVDEIAPGQWLLVAPLMGLSGRLGTVVVGYRPPPFALGK